MANSEPLRSIHVVAGVITDARGRILLTRRTEGRDLAGRWEFPGGKREPGETSEQALVRELEEELGIRAEVGDWIIDVPQRYPDKRLRLEVRRIRSFKGTPRGHEGQAMLWVMPDKLDRYDMPPADKPVVGALLQPDRYLVMPAPSARGGAQALAALERALLAGGRRVLLDQSGLDPAHRDAWNAPAVALCTRYRAQALVHDDVALAMALGTGLHLSPQSLMAMTERPVGEAVCLAATCDGPEALAAAQTLGCDFALLDVPSADEGEAVDWVAFKRLRETSALPLYVSHADGVSLLEIEVVRRHGAQGSVMRQAPECDPA